MIEVTQIKVVRLLDVLHKLQLLEAVEYDIRLPAFHVSYKLPDGRDNIKDRLWDVFIDAWWGNQSFSNDSLFRFNVDQNCIEITEDIAKLVEVCSEAINSPDGSPYITFDVSW